MAGAPTPPDADGTNGSVRALPLQPGTFAGETVRSFYARLAASNDLPQGELWTAIRKKQPGLPLRTTPHLAPGPIEELGGLIPGHFREQAFAQTLFVRCPHNGWKHGACPSCLAPPSPVRMCRRCASGQVIEVRRALPSRGTVLDGHSVAARGRARYGRTRTLRRTAHPGRPRRVVASRRTTPGTATRQVPRGSRADRVPHPALVLSVPRHDVDRFPARDCSDRSQRRRYS